MKRLMVLAASLLLSSATLACGSTKGSRRTAGPRLDANSVALNGIDQACGEAATPAVTVLCPTWLPGGNGDQWAGGLVGGAGRCGYLVSIIGRSASDVPFHVMFGGRCQRFSLAQTRGGRWPIEPNFTDYLELVGEGPPRPGPHPAPTPVRLRVVQRTTVAAIPALVVQVASYPNAGIQKSHYAIVWNRGTDGYELSFHYAPRGDRGLPPTHAEVQALRMASGEMVTRG